MVGIGSWKSLELDGITSLIGRFVGLDGCGMMRGKGGRKSEVDMEG